MIQLLLVGIGVLVVISGGRALMAAGPSVSDEVRKAKTGVSTPGSAKVVGVVQLVLGAAMVVAGLTISVWLPK